LPQRQCAASPWDREHREFNIGIELLTSKCYLIEIFQSFP
jgi:hypothetical protein